MSAKLEALVEQAREVVALLQNHLQAYPRSRDERRSLLMAIHRLERGLAGQTGTDPARTLADWLTEDPAASPSSSPGETE